MPLLSILNCEFHLECEDQEQAIVVHESVLSDIKRLLPNSEDVHVPEGEQKVIITSYPNHIMLEKHFIPHAGYSFNQDGLLTTGVNYYTPNGSINRTWNERSHLCSVDRLIHLTSKYDSIEELEEFLQKVKEFTTVPTLTQEHTNMAWAYALSEKLL